MHKTKYISSFGVFMTGSMDTKYVNTDFRQLFSMANGTKSNLKSVLAELLDT